MRMQTCLYLKNGTRISKIVRAEDIDEAIWKLMCSEDISFALKAYAHPWQQKVIHAENWRYNVRCSASGKRTMPNKKLGKEVQRYHSPLTK